MIKQNNTVQHPVDEVALRPDQLCPGLFVRLKLGWMDHPFVFNQFRIASEEQVEQIRALGLEHVVYVPSRSTAQPLSAEGEPVSSSPDSGQLEQSGSVESGPAGDDPHQQVVQDEAGQQAVHLESKASQARRIAEVRARISRCEKGYVAAATQVRQVMQAVNSSSDKSVQLAHGLVSGVVSSFAEEGEMVIHLMNEKLAEESAYFHVLNVMVLSLLLGRELKLPAEVLHVLGEGALMHDIGKLRVPDAVLRNPHRNRHEQEFYRLHTVYGREMAQELGGVVPAVHEIIQSHHETVDGKGYPAGLSGQSIPLLARIVGITNRYDNLCNPLVRTEAVTPAEALAHMFRDEASRWDRTILQRFIRMMGVYPPGSLVQLSNGNIALVVAVDHADLLRPSVLVFDPSIPRAEAIVIDLAHEPEVKIDLALRPTDLEKDALDYLAPRRRMSYFHSSHSHN